MRGKFQKVFVYRNNHKNHKVYTLKNNYTISITTFHKELGQTIALHTSCNIIIDDSELY